MIFIFCIESSEVAVGLSPITSGQWQRNYMKSEENYQKHQQSQTGTCPFIKSSSQKCQDITRRGTSIIGWTNTLQQVNNWKWPYNLFLEIKIIYSFFTRTTSVNTFLLSTPTCYSTEISFSVNFFEKSLKDMKSNHHMLMNFLSFCIKNTRNKNTLKSVVECSQRYHLDIAIMWRLLQHWQW